MICKSCGAVVSDGSAFCDICGAQLEKEENVVNSVENMQTTVDSGNLENDEMFMQQQFGIKPKKKFKFPKKIIFIAVPAIVLIVALILCWYPIGGYFVKWFGSDSDYFEYIEKHNVENTANVLSAVYDQVLSNSFEDDLTTDANIEFTLGKKTFDIIEGAYPDVDFSAFKGIDKFNVRYSTDIEDSNMQVQAGIGIGGKDIVNAYFIADAVEGDMYLGVPELSDKYIRLPNNTDQDFAEVLEAFDSAKDIFPDESAVNDLLNKYIDIAFSCLSDDYVVVEDGEIVANDIEQDCTVIEVEFTDKLLFEIFVEILDNAKDDEDLEEVIDLVQEALEEIAGRSMDVDLHKELSKGIDTLIDEIEESIDNIEKEESLFFLIDYVSSTHKVIGRRLDIMDVDYIYDEATYDYITEKNRETLFFIGKADDGDCGYELWVNSDGDGFKIVGVGSESFTGALSGQFEFVFLDSVGEKEKSYSMFTLEVEDLSCDFTELSGVLKITLGKDFAEMFGSDSKQVNSVLSMLEPSIEITMDNESDYANNTIKLFSNDDMMLEIKIEANVDNDASVEIPSKKNVLDSDEIDKWLEDVNVEALYDKLKDAGLSDEIIDMFESSNKTDDSYYDDYYGYGY